MRPESGRQLAPVGFYQATKLPPMLRFSRLEEGFEGPVQRPGSGL